MKNKAKKYSKTKIYGLAFVSIVVVLGLVLIGVFVAKTAMKNRDITQIDRLSREDDGNNIKLEKENSIAAASETVSKSVVSISVVSSNNVYTTSSSGTGIIISEDGYIITNKHVIGSANNAVIMTSDGDIYDNVKKVGEDPLNDIAFLKVDKPQNFVPAKLGQSKTIRTGQTVVAIGNSLGEYQNTVTSGIVSGLGRPVSAASEDGETESLTDLIQTDAAINPGNSGGPLINLAGQVIGINTAIVDNANGIGFAIPIDATKGMIKGLKRNGKIERAFLGVRYVDVNPVIAKAQKLSVKKGALVGGNGSAEAIQKGGPADKAGIKDKDIIIKINDSTVGVDGSLSSLISEYQPGDRVKVTLLRDGKEQTVTVDLGKYEPSEADKNTNQGQTAPRLRPQLRRDPSSDPSAEQPSLGMPDSLFGF